MSRQERALPWTEWLLSRPFGLYFVEIDEDFMSSPFNFYGIRQKVPHFKLAWNLIRGNYVEPANYPRNWPKNLNDYGIMLYGALHARYLMTDSGMARMREKYALGAFEQCPRTLCGGTQCLPFGFSEETGKGDVKLFCPNCQDVYAARNKECAGVDGAFFGPSWALVFVKRYGEIVPQGTPEKYEPRLFGYKILGLKEDAEFA